MNLTLPTLDVPTWLGVRKSNAQARALADRHYSRQTIGADDFMPPGKVLVLVTPCGRAVWGAIENLDPVGELRWRVSIFRNEGAGRSSDLIRSATETTRRFWVRRYGSPPPAPLRTEIDPLLVRRKRDPGRCFLRAGWRVVGRTSGAAHGRADLVVLEAP